MATNANHVLNNPIPDTLNVNKKIIRTLLKLLAQLLHVRIPFVKPLVRSAINIPHLFDREISLFVRDNVMFNLRITIQRRIFAPEGLWKN